MSRTAAANIACVALSYWGFVVICGRFERGFTPAGEIVGRIETGIENLVKRSKTILTYHNEKQGNRQKYVALMFYL